MDFDNENYKSRLNRKMFDVRSSEFNPRKRHLNKARNGDKFQDEEMDRDYAWLLNFLIETDEQTKVTRCEDDDDDNDDDNEIKEDDDTDRDHQYCMFLKALTKHGKSYKVNISGNDEAPCFLIYEEQENSEVYDPQTYMDGNNGDDVNASEDVEDMQIDQRVKRSLQGEKGKIHEHKSTTDSCYQKFLDGCVPSEYGAFVYEGKQVKYEENATTSDSDILIWDKDDDRSEVNYKPTKEDPSLTEKLMQILNKPYNQIEYDDLLEYAKQKKPVCRTLPLRSRAISSALGAKKSMLDEFPDFRRKLNAAKDERPRALNLLRMFKFWIEHVPNEDSFKPWLDADCLKVLPSTHII